MLKTRTSDLGVQSRDMGTARMSEVLQALLYSQEGNLTLARPSCSLMDMTTPTLPRTPLPTTCRAKESQGYWCSHMNQEKVQLPPPELTWTSEPILIVSLKPPRAQSAATACLPMDCSLASFLPLLLPFSRMLSAYFPSWGMNIRARERTYRTVQSRNYDGFINGEYLNLIKARSTSRL